MQSDSVVIESTLDAFRAAAAAGPDTIAFSNGVASISYGELDAMSDRVARGLIEQSPHSDTSVAVVAGGGVSTVVAYFAARKANRRTTVLDARAPEGYVLGCAERLAPFDVLTDEATADVAHALVGHALVIEELAAIDADHDLPSIDPDAPSLVVFTSGSTGRPKGVVHSERVALATQRRNADSMRTTSADRFGAISAGTGSGSTALLHALISGLPTYGFDLTVRGLLEVPEWVAAHGVTVVGATRGLLRTLADALPADRRLEPLRLVRTVGEPLLPGDVAAAHRVLPEAAEFRYEFGMNETGILTARGIDRVKDDTDRAVTLVGWPLDGVDLRIVGDDGSEVATGEVGEIVVRGSGICLGYLGEPELNAERFRGEGDDRVFETRDLGRILDDGQLEILGRSDERFKIRAFTIEPAEVEAALVALPDVAEAGVTSAPNATGAPMLVAYVVPAPGARLRSQILRSQLAARAASQFVPSAFYAVPELPRTVTGKVNRAALRTVAAEALAVRPAYEAPVGARESVLASLVADVLRIEQVGRHDDIFDLGADSLDLLELFAALHEQFQIDLPERTVLEAPTVAKLSSRLAAAPAEGTTNALLLAGGGLMTPFFCVTGRRSFAFRLRPLAQALVSRNDRPFYGLEAYRPAAGSDRALSIASMAEDHVQSVREIQPHGPYLLGGHSAGGLVAYEMARQLRADGEDVSLVVLIDSGFSMSMGMRLRRRLIYARTRWPGRGPRDRLRRAKHYAVHARRVIAERSGGTRRMLAAGGSEEELEKEYAMRSVDNIVRRSFHVQPYDGRVLYVRASELALEGEFADTRDAPDVLRGAVTGPLSIVTVPGTHASLIDPGYVDHVANAIDEALDDVDVAASSLGVR